MKRAHQSKQRRAVAALASMAVMGALFLQSLASPKLALRRALLEGSGDAVRFRRGLAADFGLGGYEEEEDYDAAFETAFAKHTNESQDEGAAAMAARHTKFQPYTLEDTYVEARAWDYTFCILVYDPPSDKFLVVYSKDHSWNNGNRKMFRSVRDLAYSLRQLFPDRFTPRSPEFVVAIGGGDYPHVRTSKLPRAEGVAPVLMFGSAFREKSVYPNMVAMPMPAAGHLPCFVDWASGGEGRKEVCKDLRAKTYDEEWDDLIPQLIWRGTDFNYLLSLQPRPSLIHPGSRYFIQSGQPEGDKRVGTIRALNEGYDRLLPRWKGVALSAEAELEAQGTEKLPWADIRFSSYIDARKRPTLGSPKYSAWESAGIAVGARMSLSELARYKYHIDLGGGGGTTWSGTLEKLAMPGLLFHHVTPMKDYYHDWMVPWKHYVPVGPDLKDLRRKFEWAEGHPEEARRIAEAGTEFARRLGTPEVFGTMFREYYEEFLRGVIEAYQPVSTMDGRPSTIMWKEVLQSIGRLMPVMECSGLASEASCRVVGRWR